MTIIMLVAIQSVASPPLDTYSVAEGSVSGGRPNERSPLVAIARARMKSTCPTEGRAISRSRRRSHWASASSARGKTILALLRGLEPTVTLGLGLSQELRLQPSLLLGVVDMAQRTAVRPAHHKGAAQIICLCR